MIIKKTAFCSNGSSCCPSISINTDNSAVTITDDFDGTLNTDRGTFLSANFFAKKLNDKTLDISVSATFRELGYIIGIANRDEVYYLSLESKGQKVRDITLEQWNILADAVYKSYEPVSFILEEELVNV